MARNFRIYEKKRGNRRTGSKTVASIGEAVFFAVLLVLGCMGIIAAVVWFVVPEWRVNHGFIRNQCRVISSTVGEKEGGNDNTLYRPEVKIEYRVNDAVYRPVTYDIHQSYSSSREEAQAAADAFLADEEYDCWYDPADPGRAVVVQGYQWWVWLVLSVPISFVVIGAGGLLYSRMHWGKSTERRAAGTRRISPADLLDPARGGPHLPTVPDATDIESSPGTKLTFRLPLSRSPAWALFGLLVANLLWNVPVAVFAVMAVQYHLEGRPDWKFTLFVAACLAGGLALLACFVRQLLVTTGIGPTLVEISAHPLLPGEKYRLFVSQSGRLKMKLLDVSLVCEEEATYRQGTNTRTETREVCRQPIVRREGFDIRHNEPFEAECELSVPPGAMHSFKAGYNQIQWRVVVRGDVANWPDFARSFPVIVHPRSARSLA